MRLLIFSFRKPLPFQGRGLGFEPALSLPKGREALMAKESSRCRLRPNPLSPFLEEKGGQNQIIHTTQ